MSHKSVVQVAAFSSIKLRGKQQLSGETPEVATRKQQGTRMTLTQDLRECNVSQQMIN